MDGKEDVELLSTESEDDDADDGEGEFDAIFVEDDGEAEVWFKVVSVVDVLEGSVMFSRFASSAVWCVVTCTVSVLA